MAATYKWDLQQIGKVTPAQGLMLWHYAQERIGSYFEVGEKILGGFGDSFEGGGAPSTYSPRPRRGGMTSIDNIELSPAVMAAAHERMKEIRKQKGRKLPLPEGEMETYNEGGILRKVIRQTKKPKE